jgi:uncharacterized CHY-type Zn-finger protein
MIKAQDSLLRNKAKENEYYVITKPFDQKGAGNKEFQEKFLESQYRNYQGLDNESSKYVVNTILSAKDKKNEEEYQGLNLQQCGFCKRKFQQSRIEYHEYICEKLKRSKREKFNSARMRTIEFPELKEEDNLFGLKYQDSASKKSRRRRSRSPGIIIANIFVEKPKIHWQPKKEIVGLQCNTCGKYVLKERLKKHQDLCLKKKAEDRFKPKFDSLAQRISCFLQYELLVKKGGLKQKAKKAESNKWKYESEDLRKDIYKARESHSFFKSPTSLVILSGNLPSSSMAHHQENKSIANFDQVYPSFDKFIRKDVDRMIETGDSGISISQFKILKRTILNCISYYRTFDDDFMAISRNLHL